MSLVERAFCLAASAKFHSVTELDRALMAEGNTYAELEQLRGVATRRKLREIIESSRSSD
jgi:hypothetical protein